MKGQTAVNIDEYILRFPAHVQERMHSIRAAILQLVPDAEEAIKYAMPAFVYHGNLVYFAGFKNHIGFYPAPTGNSDFKNDLAPYKTGKGSVQFPLDKPLPLKLISKIVKFRVKENLAREKAKLKE